MPSSAASFAASFARRRFLVIASGLFAAVTAAAVLAAVLAVNLPALAEWAAPAAFERLGLKGGLEVRQLGWRRAVIADPWIGPGLGGEGSPGEGGGGEKAVSARLAILDYDLGGFPEILIRRVSLAGLKIHARADAAGISLGPLSDLAIGGGEADGFLRWAVERLELDGAVVSIDTPQGTLTLDLAGTIDLDPGGGFSGRLRLTRTALPVLPLAVEGLTGRVSFEGSGVQLDSLNARLTADRLKTGAVAVDNPRLDITLLDNQLSLRVEGLAPAGAVTLTAQGPLPADLSDPLELTGRATASLDGFPLPGIAPETLSLGDGVLNFSLDRGRLELDGTVATSAGPLTLTARGPLPAGLADPLQITGRATASLDGFPLPGVPPETLSLKEGVLNFSLDRGRLELDGTVVTSAGPLTLSATGPLPLLGPGLPGGWTATVNADLSGMALPGLPELGDGLALNGSLEVAAGGGAYTFVSSDTNITAPGLAALTGLAFTATYDQRAERPLKLTVSRATFRHLAPAAAVTPLIVTGRAALAADGRADFSATARDTGGGLSARLSGSHQTKTGRGRASIHVAPLVFTPAAGPGLLFPILAGVIEEVTGEVEIKGGVAWRKGGQASGFTVTSDLKLLARDLSFSAGEVRMERLNTVITFDRPWPPSTPPGQVAAIALIDAGLPLSDNLIVFQLTAEGRLRVERMAIHLAGGRVRTNDTIFDLTSDQHAFTLEASGIDLGRLLALVDLEGLSGTGTLAGRIPVRIRGNAVEIKDGYLESIAPGVLRYAPTTPPAALQGSGETGKLLLQALENFQYQTLKASIDRQAGGETLVGLHLKGANPDLLEGYPIEFNLNVSGMLDAILRNSLAGYRVPDAIRKRMENFGG